LPGSPLQQQKTLQLAHFSEQRLRRKNAIFLPKKPKILTDISEVNIAHINANLLSHFSHSTFMHTVLLVVVSLLSSMLFSRQYDPD